MKHIKSFQKHNEEVSLKKTLATGAILGGLAGGLAGGLVYVHDKSIEPRETVQSQHVDIPNYFQLKKKMLSIGTDMYVTNDNRDNFGKIEERTLSWGRTFQYYDNTGKILATAKQEIFSFGTKINITDENGEKIGSVEQELFEFSTFRWVKLPSGSFLRKIPMLSFYSIYSIKDATGKTIAKSKKIDLFSANVDIFDMSGQFVANFDQSGFKMKWDCKIESSSIDRRLLIFIGPFISAAQDVKREEKDKKKEEE